MIELVTRSDVAKFGRLESGLVTHGCAMCGATVAHDSHMLNGHVNAVHRMSLKDYFMKYIDTHESASRTEGSSGSSIEATSNAKSNWMNQCEFKVSHSVMPKCIQGSRWTPFKRRLLCRA